MSEAKSYKLPVTQRIAGVKPCAITQTTMGIPQASGSLAQNGRYRLLYDSLWAWAPLGWATCNSVLPACGIGQ